MMDMFYSLQYLQLLPGTLHQEIVLLKCYKRLLYERSRKMKKNVREWFESLWITVCENVQLLSAGIVSGSYIIYEECVGGYFCFKNYECQNVFISLAEMMEKVASGKKIYVVVGKGDVNVFDPASITNRMTTSEGDITKISVKEISDKILWEDVYNKCIAVAIYIFHSEEDMNWDRFVQDEWDVVDEIAIGKLYAAVSLKKDGISDYKELYITCEKGICEMDFFIEQMIALGFKIVKMESRKKIIKGRSYDK